MYGNLTCTRSQDCLADSILRDVLHKDFLKARWPSKRILRRWFCFTERKLRQHRDAEKLLITLESRHAWLEPKLRLTLPKEAYDVFLQIFEDKRIVSEPLEAYGVVRDDGGNSIQFWCADACLKKEPMMQYMLDEAMRCRDTYEANEVRIAMHYSSPLIMKCTDKLTLHQVRKRVEKRFHIKAHKQILSHKGHQLVRGPLCEQGVHRGSVIIVSERATIP